MSKIKKIENSYVTDFKNIFEEWYENETQTPYYWTVKDAANCNRLASKICFTIQFYDRKNGRVVLEPERYRDRIIEGFKHILLICRKDDVTDKNLSIAIINSRYNQIIKFVNGKSAKQRDIERKFTNFSLG